MAGAQVSAHGSPEQVGPEWATDARSPTHAIGPREKEGIKAHSIVVSVVFVRSPKDRHAGWDRGCSRRSRNGFRRDEAWRAATRVGIFGSKPRKAGNFASIEFGAAAVYRPPATAVSAPPAPDWPANEQPSDAIVTWDRQGLRVVAVNSSLTQILKAIARQTGATLEGANKDERIFGVYGPGPARDVISQLLDGSGYNVLLVGELGQGAPRQIILTARTAAGPQPGKVNSQSTAEDQDTEAGQEAQQPEPPPGAPAGPARSREQGLQGLQDRQQKKLQEQLQQMQEQLNAQ